MKKHWYILPLLLLLAGGTALGQSGAATQPPDEMAPQNLDWTLTQEGNVRLAWDEPSIGVNDLEKYVVLRAASDNSLDFKQIANTNLEKQYIDLSVEPGDIYHYAVQAVYYNDPIKHSAFTTVSYPVNTPIFEIVSTPPPTLKTGIGYQYLVELNADPQITSITPHVEDAPEGVEAWIINNNVRVTWGSPETGVYNFTLVVTGLDNAGQTVKATQNIRLVVSPRTGAVDIAVYDIAHNPIPFSHIQLMLLAEDVPSTKINVLTNEEGRISLSDVPVGNIIAYCYPGDEKYAPKYYNPAIYAKTLSQAEPQVLGEEEVLSLEFFLQEIGDGRVTVSGIVQDENDFAVSDAKVHFIRKSNFIIIGDYSLDNPVLIENWSQSKIDTTVVTDIEGKYSTLLPVGVDYFIIVEGNGFYDCFNPDLYYNSNALEARPFLTKKGEDESYNFRLEAKSNQTNSVQGVVRREGNNLSEPATVLLIKKEVKLQRGTGGGVFYGYGGVRSVLTDSNGVYEFQNVPENQYILFAIPLNRDVVPQYFTDSFGGAMTFENSSLITVNNTIQNKDFLLKSAESDGLGTVYGVVNLQKNDEDPKRLSGAVVLAIDPDLDRIVGYAVSDSLGRYAIPNLRPAKYHVIADHPAHGWDKIDFVDLQYTSLDDAKRDAREDLTIHITVSGIDDFDPSNIPADVVLHQNFPNPFNPSTNIKFGLSKSMSVKLSVYNVYGQEVEVLEEGNLDPGTYSFQFDASNLASGMYFYRLTAGTKILTRSMMLVK